MDYTNDQQAILEKAIENYLAKNKELVLNRILSITGLEISASQNKDIKLNTSGTGEVRIMTASKIVFERSEV